jgi:hypothetical protein
MGYIGAGISRFNTADELTVTGDATIDTTTLVVDSTNNRVGIGIAAPSEELEISGTGVQTLKLDRTDASTAGALTINSANGSNYIYNLTAKKLIFGTNNNSGLTLDENNKIGIGTTAPAHNVEIVATAAGSVNDSLQIRNNATSSGTGSRIRFINSTDNTSDTNGASISSVRNGNDNNLVFETENAERMRLDASGNLLVGKTAEGVGNVGFQARPDGFLAGTRNGGTVSYLNRLSSDGEILRFQKDSSTVGSIGTLSGRMYAGSGDVGVFFDSTNNMITPYSIDAGDTVDNTIDLGYSSRRFKDGYFNGSVYTTYVKGNGGHTGQVHFTGSHDVRFVTNGSERARFDDSANFLVGATSLNDTNGFTVFPTGSGSATMVRIDRNSNGTALQFRQGQSSIGTVSTTTSGVTYNTSSDRRLKSNIQDAESASDKIDAIQVRQFDWNADDSHQDYGLIAQELQPIEPMAVTGDADSDEMMGVDYSKLVPMLIKEIQELRGRVAALEAN